VSESARRASGGRVTLTNADYALVRVTEGKGALVALDQETVRSIADAYTAAWNSGSAEAVAGFYAEDGSIVINRGSPWEGRSGVAQMAAGFFADVPDLALVCDAVRVAGSHAAYLWTFTGTHESSGNRLRVSGWEEWELDDDYKVKTSRGWFDAEDYGRQTSREIPQP
jgi:uncharacterized protein (TIGR02246 family)